jgi:hypothetical protein
MLINGRYINYKSQYFFIQLQTKKTKSYKDRDMIASNADENIYRLEIYSPIIHSEFKDLNMNMTQYTCCLSNNVSVFLRTIFSHTNDKLHKLINFQSQLCNFIKSKKSFEIINMARKLEI